MYGMMWFKVLSALFLLLQKIIQSSAYRTNLYPLRVSSLSDSFSIMLLRSGLNWPPWVTPTSVLSNKPFCTTPAFRYLCINKITLPSLMLFCSLIFTYSLIWFLFVRPEICHNCLQIPPHGGHPWCSAMSFPPLRWTRDFHPLDFAHAGRTERKSQQLLMLTL